MINIQNIDDNECFKWCLARYLNPANHHPARIQKADKDFAKILDFKDINFPVKIRDIHKIKKKKKDSIGISCLVLKIKKNIQSMYQKKCFEEKHVDLLLIGEGDKDTMFLSMISIDSCIIIHYIAEENIFIVIIYML